MKLPQSTYLHSEAVTLQIQSELPIFDEDRDLLLASAFVPGASLSLDEWEGPISKRLYIKEGDSCRVERQEEDIIIHDTWEDGMPLHMIHLLYSVVQGEHLRRGNYPVHSSCVTKDDKGYLFIGHSGSGKTTSALTMVREHDFGWFSGNKTLITFDGQANESEYRSMRATAGTLPVTVEVSNTATGLPVFDENIKIPFVDRELRMLKDQYHYTEEDVTINGIFFVRVNNGVQKCSQLSPDGAAISLFPFFYDYFNTDIHLPGGEMFNPGFVDDGHRKALEGQLHGALQEIPIFQVSGSFEYMADKVKETVE